MNIKVDPAIETQAILAGWPKPRLCGRYVTGGKRCEHYSFSAPVYGRQYCNCCLTKMLRLETLHYPGKYWDCDGTMKP